MTFPLLEGHSRQPEASAESAVPSSHEQHQAVEIRAVENGTRRIGAVAIHAEQAEVVESDRDNEVFRVSRNPQTYEITVESDVTAEDYESITRPEDWALLQHYAERMQGKTVAFINPTFEGGGVAMLRPPLVHLLRQHGVDARWYVMEGSQDPDAPSPFLFTKQMHNIIQRRTPEDERITEEGKAIHQKWNAENAEVLYQQEPLQNADVIVVDDPQPAPLISGLKEINPEAKIVWRNHIDNSGELMENPATPQGEVWQYLRDDCAVGSADAYVFHPVDKFVPEDIRERTYFAPATIETYDDLNKKLSPEEVAEGMNFINAGIAAKNLELEAEGREIDQQNLLDPDRRRITLIARFDESKGMDKAMELGAQARQAMLEAGAEEADLPEIVIVGNGSVDDPSGAPMLEKMLRLRRQYPEDVRRGIILTRLKHNYAAINALMYTSDIGLQTSEAEGCETRITDWIEHGVPVVVANRGGMPLQVQEGKSGYILDFDKPDHDINRGATLINNLLTNHEDYQAMRQSTLEAYQQYNTREYTTTANTIRWLRLFNNVLDDTAADKYWRLSDLTSNA